MSKTILSRKFSKTEEGLTLLEVIVSIIVTFLFLMGTLQLVVYAALARIQAEEQSAVTRWIREDSDFLKYLGSELSCNADPNYDQYAQDLINKLNSINDSELNEYKQDSRTKKLKPNNPATRKYTFTREKVANGNTLELTYSADFQGDTTACSNPDSNDTSTWVGCIGVTYVEVVPNAAFDCVPSS